VPPSEGEQPLIPTAKRVASAAKRIRGESD
jgi:hypothetical protein